MATEHTESRAGSERRVARFEPSTVHIYCAAVFLGSIAALVALHNSLDLGFAVRQPVTFALLAAGVVLAETLPVRIPRRGENEVITLSSSFVMALLLAGGLGPAIVAQGVALAVPDLISRRPGWRIRFNLGQYTLSVIAAFLVLKGLGETGAVGTSHPFGGTQLPGVLLSAAVFFIVNTGLVGIAVALFQRVPLLRYFRSDFVFVFATAGVLLLLAPIVIATAAYSALLMPLFAAPMLAIHQALKAGERSRHAARHDSLTSLPNRVAFQEGVEDAIKDRDSLAAVLLMDLDRFKDVNDTLGHHHGDLLLQQVAERLLALDLGGEIARLGGDEFAVLIADCTSEHAVGVAHEVAASLRPPFQLEQVVVDVQASVGIAMFPADGDEVQTLLQKADVAMYRAKGTNRDIVLYNERDDDHSPSKLALSADLRAALEQREIIAWYQPELDLRSGQVFAVEALVRWPHPSLGMLSPDSFIGMSETTSLIKPLTQLVLDVALRQLSIWDGLDLRMMMAVNISTAVLIDKNFTSSVVAALEYANVTPDRLKLEVTESTLMADPDTAMAILLELSQLGIEISIDDFGTGYSSLAYLAGLPAAEVKIDRSFVARMGDSFKDSAIVSSTIDLAHHLGLRAVAEGVEDNATLERLRALQCDAVQGFGISRPRRADDLTPWLLAEQSAVINATARSAA
jgi:diguanylate cyclase (GGDEF)-like protein